MRGRLTRGLRSSLSVLLSLAFLGAACGSDESATQGATNPPAGGESIVSQDGVVTLEVPPGFDGVTVEPVERDELPAPIRDANADVFAYELGPDGTEFDEPVTVTLRISATHLAAGDVPLAVLAFEQSNGTFRAAPTTEVVRRGDELQVSGTTTHFSKAVAVLANIEFRLSPARLELGVGEARTVSLLPSPVSDDVDLAGRLLVTGGIGPMEVDRDDLVKLGDPAYEARLTTWGTADFLRADDLIDPDTTWGEWLAAEAVREMNKVTRDDAILDLADPNPRHHRELTDNPNRWLHGDAWQQAFDRNVAELTDAEIDEALASLRREAANDFFDLTESGDEMGLRDVLSTEAVRVTCLGESDGVVSDAYRATVVLHDGEANASAENPILVDADSILSDLGVDPTDEFGNLRIHVTVHGDAVCAEGAGSGTDDTSFLEMPDALPTDRRATAAGELDAFVGDDAGRADAAVSSLTVSLNPSCEGGKILITPGNGPDSEGVSGELVPDGRGGFTWQDNVKLDYDVGSGTQYEDADEVSDVSLEDGVLTFSWSRTNFDGTTWEAQVSVPVPPGTSEWWEELDAPAPPEYNADFSWASSGNSIVVEGTTDAPDGTVFEVVLADGTSKRIQVQDGKFSATLTDPGGSGGSAVQVLHGSHVLGCSSS